MFSASGIRANYHTNENSDNLLQAKRTGGLGSARKPLQDKAVNERNVDRFLKNKDLKAVKTPSPKVEPNDLWADICSYKEMRDDMEDMWPHSDCLQISGVVKILESYANRCSTPTPRHYVGEDDIKPALLETPTSHFDRFEIFSDDEMYAHEVSIADVSLPAVDLDSF